MGRKSFPKSSKSNGPGIGHASASFRPVNISNSPQPKGPVPRLGADLLAVAAKELNDGWGDFLINLPTEGATSSPSRSSRTGSQSRKKNSRFFGAKGLNPDPSPVFCSFAGVDCNPHEQSSRPTTNTGQSRVDLAQARNDLCCRALRRPCRVFILEAWMPSSRGASNIPDNAVAAGRAA